MDAPYAPKPEQGKPQNRGRTFALTWGLVAATAVLVYTCYLLSRPLLPALAWALALAVVAHPLHAWLEKRCRSRNLAATLALGIVAICLVVPALFVMHRLAREVTLDLMQLQQEIRTGQWEMVSENNPVLASVQRWLSENLDLQGEASRTFQHVVNNASTIVTTSVWTVLETLTVFFALFYFFRDRQPALHLLRSLLPLTDTETDAVFLRVKDVLHATIYGTLLCAALQGALGGLMFWWLGLPSPVLWGIIMGLLAIVPYLGAFVIWIPAAIYLAIVGAWDKAFILTVWGGVVIALSDNILYPVMVSKRMRLHSLAVFVAAMGGIVLFGASGVILGPVILALTDATVHVWRQRLAASREIVPGGATPVPIRSEPGQPVTV